MIMFGGIHELTQELNDMHAYDFNKQHWFCMLDDCLSPHDQLNVGYGYSPMRKSFIKNSPPGLSSFKPDGSSRNRATTAMAENQTTNNFGISVQQIDQKSKSRQGTRYDDVLVANIYIIGQFLANK